MSPRTRTERERIDDLWARIDNVSQPSGCWPWVGSVSGGYGDVTWWDGEKSVKTRAHVVVRNLSYGLPALHRFPGNVTRHLCGNRLCCNPDHLATSNQKDNSKDAAAHGTLATGERNGRSRLVAAQVTAIRAAALAGRKQRDIAAAYGVHIMTVNDIINRRSWKHLP